ncbi:MAG: serine hydrolase [Flavobacteriia bacterium]|nr:serine hydrolase [Flavobacteriia bacterium]
MRKFIKRLVYVLLGVALFLWFVSLSPFGYLIKGVYATYLHGENSATIDDKVYFETKIVRADAIRPRAFDEDLSDAYAPSEELRSLLDQTESVALAVFYKDELKYEWYADGYGRTSRTNSFSMAKTITAMLAEMAIENGDLKGWNQKVIELLPELKGEYAEQLTLGDLSLMRGGLDWDEHYTNAFGITARAYYGESVYELLMEDVPISTPPGSEFNYQSGATQLLGLCVQRATGRSLSELTSEWIWTPAGAQDDAEWHVDDSGQELCYCCFNSNAIDFARIGHILLHEGTWNNHLFMDSSAANSFFKPLSTPYYGRSIWMAKVDDVSFSYLRGVNGQYIIIIPEYDAVIVRLGHQVGPLGDEAQRLPKIVADLVRYYTEKIDEVSRDTEW